MSSLHLFDSTPSTEGLCPITGTKGRPVDTATVKAMLSVSLRQVRNVPYRFCAEPECDVVYYSDDGTQTFSVDEVRERVYQKEPNAGDVYICYCFRHTPDSIHQDLAEKGTASAVDDINAGIKAGQCACDWRNPEGACCLGNVLALVKTMTGDIEG